MDTPNDAGGGDTPLNGELQDQAVTQDEDMEEGLYNLDSCYTGV